jgi:glycosyltransferase involved in cell wall biosynthesis
MTDSFEPSDALWYKAMRRLHLHGRHNSNHLSRLREAYINDKIDLIYVNSVASARMLEFLSFIDCPVVCHVHELGGAIAVLGVENMARLEERKPVYIAVSHAVKNSLVTNHRISPDRIEVIHGFVPRSRSTIDSKIAHKIVCGKLGIPEQAMLVCACGSIEFRKGTDIFLQVADRVVQEYTTVPVHFVWVGGTSERVEAMRRQVAKSALRDVVHFVGATSETEAYFKASEVFILTSREDPFPLVMMEAAQQGKPVVCFEKAGGASEFVEADAGFAIPDFSYVGMGEKIVKLLSSPGLRDQMGLVAKRKVLARHNLDLGATRVAAIIANTMESSGGADGAMRKLSDTTELVPYLHPVMSRVPD